MPEIIPAIMSGGSGTRLWPLSTDARAKQFHALASDRTMIQETALRLRGAHGDVVFGPPVVIGNAGHAQLIADQLAHVDLQPEAVILEPAGRNTAATAAVAAEFVRRRRPGALVLLVPADHVIQDVESFRRAVTQAASAASECIVTFGVVPTRPETGYGYIQAGSTLGEGLFAISSFKEKPNAATAADYLATGGYFWNAGMFLFDPEVMLSEFSGAADIRDAAIAALDAAREEGDQIWLAPSFVNAPSAPIDIAVMEKTTRGAVVPCDIGWADIGSWFELWRVSDKDERGNATSGAVAALECDGALFRSEGIPIAAAGLSDIIVVATPEAVLVVHKDRAQDVKKLWELMGRSRR